MLIKDNLTTQCSLPNSQLFVAAFYFLPEDLTTSLVWEFNGVHKLGGNDYNTYSCIYIFIVQSHNHVSTVWWCERLWNQKFFHKFVATWTHLRLSIVSTCPISVNICTFTTEIVMCLISACCAQCYTGVLDPIFQCEMRTVPISAIHGAPKVWGKGLENEWMDTWLSAPYTHWPKFFSPWNHTNKSSPCLGDGCAGIWACLWKCCQVAHCQVFYCSRMALDFFDSCSFPLSLHCTLEFQPCLPWNQVNTTDRTFHHSQHQQGHTLPLCCSGRNFPSWTIQKSVFSHLRWTL